MDIQTFLEIECAKYKQVAVTQLIKSAKLKDSNLCFRPSCVDKTVITEDGVNITHNWKCSSAKAGILVESLGCILVQGEIGLTAVLNNYYRGINMFTEVCETKDGERFFIEHSQLARKALRANDLNALTVELDMLSDFEQWYKNPDGMIRKYQNFDIPLNDDDCYVPPKLTDETTLIELLTLARRLVIALRDEPKEFEFSKILSAQIGNCILVGEADLITRGNIWDVKVYSSELTSKQMLQLEIYKFLYGDQSMGLKVVNPLKNVIYSF